MSSPARLDPADLPDEAPHILVVDDDRRLRELLARYLADQGFRVTAAASAEEARARAQALVFDAMVLDVMMPGENGFDYARSVRETSKVPILMLTARSNPNDRVMGLEIGADDYLPKPFDPRELTLRLNNIINRGPVRPRDADAAPVSFGPFVFRPTRASCAATARPCASPSGNARSWRSSPTPPGRASSASIWPVPAARRPSGRSTCRSTACAGRSRWTRPTPPSCRRCAASATASSSIEPPPEDRGADPDMGGAHLDRRRVIAAHAHGQDRQVALAGELREQGEMRRGRILHGRMHIRPWIASPCVSRHSVSSVSS